MLSLNSLVRHSATNCREFHAPLIRLQRTPPNPLGRSVLWAMLVFLVFVLVWAMLGKLDIIAVAEGKLVPASYLKIVQPAEAGDTDDPFDT